MADPRTLHLLIVDDEPDMRDELCSFFSDRGFRVTVAATGREGILAHESDAADAVITDIRMPGGDGHDLIGKLKAGNADLPVVVLTGHDTFENRGAYANVSSIVVLKKPVGLREIDAAVHEVLALK